MGSFYNSTKVFHFKDKLDSLPRSVDEILAPVHIRIKPTNVCNHRCAYCAYRADNLQLGQNMRVADTIPKDKMMEILDDLIEMDVKAGDKILFGKWSGTEITLEGEELLNMKESDIMGIIA